ncbi:uncharacterized protein [Oscarella lobularis]|uniref:uncharacterized protein n=1 Tax=Oscarella lobularis TaxID=121494 RepID=UPI0033137BEF
MQTETMESSTEINKSDIPLTLPDVHWFPGMELGFGFDVLTGEVKPSPFEKIVIGESRSSPIQVAVGSSSSKSTQETFGFVESSQDVEKELSVSTSLSFGLGSFSASFSTEISHHVKFSHHAVTAIRKKTVTSDSYEMLADFDLKEEAKALLKQKDMKAFRKLYGDYFVAGLKRGSSFRAYYRCNASSKEELWKVKASLEASYLSATLKNETDVSDGSKSSSSSISSSYTMSGVEGTYQPSASTLEDVDKGLEHVNKALEYFSANEKGAPFLAILRHYAFLNPEVEACVPVTPTAFQEMKEIAQHVFELEQMLKSSLTPAVQKNVQDYLNTFARNRHALAIDESKRATLLKKFREITDSLGNVRLRRKFLSMVGAAEQPDEKEYGDTVQCGFFPKSPLPEQIKADIQGFTLEVQDKNQNASNPLYFFDPEKIVVGWRVHQSGKGKDRNWTVTGRFLLKDEVKINVVGEGVVKLSVWCVNRSDYPQEAEDEE